MILEKEVQATKLSATKKDFYQIYNELLDLAGKITERWSPESTNEADPGIVLLKCLTGIADKLNYTIDKNILEAFMPSAAQQESMRKLTEMMGYAMKYYQSATTEVSISYTGDWPTGTQTNFTIPRFSVITDVDKEINYATIYDCTLTKDVPSGKIQCIEGQIVQCTSENDNLIGLINLDDNQKYYLPENTVAQNGIFILSKGSSEIDWEQVDNLNAQPNTKKCYKFGYDSKEACPYIQFPEDISSIINDGVQIYYTRTNGVNGNISAKTLTTLNKPAKWDSEKYPDFNETDFIVTNNSAAMNGTNPETITQAYNSYKKVIGTFDTLVTCRDYMNKIYNMTEDIDNTTPLVSNVIASDIRDDINRAVNICTFDEYGMSYIDKSRTITPDATVSKYSDLHTASETYKNKVYRVNETGNFYKCDGAAWNLLDSGVNYIDHFDLILYPFYPVFGTNTVKEYKKSFTYSTENKNDIEVELDNYKTLSHNIIFPTDKKDILNAADEIACVKNYLKINATITTTTKVNDLVWAIILSNIKTALFATFNMRQVDFGEEILPDLIESVIQNADSRIKNVSLEDPDLYTAIMTVDNKEYFVNIGQNEENNKTKAKKLYNQIALKNILAGKVEIFNYNEDFKPDYTEAKYPESGYDPIYPNATEPSAGNLTEVTKMESKCEVSLTSGELKNEIKLNDNEYIKFRAPNFKTTVTYPAYVNYHLVLANKNKSIPAGTEYKLGSGDTLYINYTETQTGSDGTTSKEVIVNKEYSGSGTVIIKPNFELKDSSTVHAGGKSWAKTEGYIWGIAGMFSLGTNEQIEMREQVEISLADGESEYKTYYYYWEINQANKDYVDKTTKATEKFPFKNNKYILQDGEYFFFTDVNKVNVVYYGSGTEVTRTGMFDLQIPANSTISVEDILNYGSSVIPWKQWSFNKDNNLTFKEYQYVTLIKDDKLKALKLKTTSETMIDNTWKEVDQSSVKYQKSGESEASLPAISVGDNTWEVRSGLEFNVGPTLTQTLHRQEVGTGSTKTTVTDTITLIDSDNTYEESNTKKNPSKDLTPTTTNPLSIKTTTLIQSSTEVQDTHTWVLNEDETLTSTDNFKVKVFKNENKDVTNIDNYNNFGEYWTKQGFNNDKSEFKFYINFKKDEQYALMMIYYIPNETLEESDKAYIQMITDRSSTTTAYGEPKIFNYYRGNSEKWWKDPVSTNNYILREGLNIVKIEKSCELILNRNKNENGSVIFSNLDIIDINNEKGINIDLLDYQDTTNTDTITAETRAKQLLKDLRDLDTEYIFYYNLPAEKDRVLNINSNIETEKLSTPSIFYDYNNAANKFVISEIDADHLNKGITLTRSSKL